MNQTMRPSEIFVEVFDTLLSNKASTPTDYQQIIKELEVISKFSFNTLLRLQIITDTIKSFETNLAFRNFLIDLVFQYIITLKEYRMEIDTPFTQIIDSVSTEVTDSIDDENLPHIDRRVGETINISEVTIEFLKKNKWYLMILLFNKNAGETRFTKLKKEMT